MLEIKHNNEEVDQKLDALTSYYRILELLEAIEESLENKTDRELTLAFVEIAKDDLNYLIMETKE
jgi:hypothetical protein